MTLAEELLDSTVDTYTGPEVDPEERDLGALIQAVAEIYGVDPAELQATDLEGMRPEEMTDTLWAPILEKYETKEKLIPIEILRRVERDIMLQIVDAQWKDHLYSLDHLKEGIGLRGYGQRDPLVEYKKESFALFTAMKDRVEEEIVRYLWRLTPVVGRRRGGHGGSRPAAHAATAAAAADHAELAAGLGAVALRGRRRTRRAAAGRAAPRAHRRRRRGPPGEARRAESRPQRSLPVRQREEIQEVPWRVILDSHGPGTRRAAERSLPFFFWGPEWKLEPTS